MHLKIAVQGKVQGVFFRASTRDKARQLNVLGFVKNQSDGSVYIEAEGEREILDNFINWCKQGPDNARVENVMVVEGPEQGFTTFEIRH